MARTSGSGAGSGATLGTSRSPGGFGSRRAQAFDRLGQRARSVRAPRPSSCDRDRLGRGFGLGFQLPVLMAREPPRLRPARLPPCGIILGDDPPDGGQDLLHGRFLGVRFGHELGPGPEGDSRERMRDSIPAISVRGSSATDGAILQISKLPSPWNLIRRRRIASPPRSRGERRGVGVEYTSRQPVASVATHIEPQLAPTGPLRTTTRQPRHWGQAPRSTRPAAPRPRLRRRLTSINPEGAAAGSSGALANNGQPHGPSGHTAPA